MAKVLTGRESGQSLWVLIEAANQLFDAQITALLEPLDLTIESMKVLYVVDDGDGATIKELQAASGMDPEKFVVIIRALQLRGLISRPRPKEDPEATVIRFTTEGRLKVRRAHTAIERFQERAGGWLGSQRAPLLTGLRRLSELPPLPEV